MGRTARIDRDGVIAAGLALADAGGLAAVTMAAVAARLGVTPMALYRHVGDKADLLDGMVEHLVTEVPPPTTGPWFDRLARLAGAVRESARRHPNVFPLLLQRPANTPGARQVRDGVCSALEEGGVDPARSAQVERLLSTAVLGFAASEAAGRFSHHSPRQLDQDFALLLEMLLRFVESGVTTVDGAAPDPRGPPGAPLR